MRKARKLDLAKETVQRLEQPQLIELKGGSGLPFVSCATCRINGEVCQNEVSPD